MTKYFVLISIFILAGCSTTKGTTRVDTDEPYANPRSGRSVTASLQPDEKVDDPFLNNIEDNDNKDLELSIAPQPKPAEATPVLLDSLQAFSVQLRAYGVESSAKELVDRLQLSETDSVNYHKDGHLFKVKIGPYFSRVEADSKRDYYKNGEFPGAWVVPVTVYKPVQSQQEIIKTSLSPDNVKISGDGVLTDSYYIQIASASNRQNAENFLLRNSSLSGLPVTIFEQSGFFKLVVGPFENREGANDSLPEIRKSFPDAWIIQAK